QTLRGLLEMLRGRGRWTRPHAARELAYLAQQRPEVFDRRTVGQLNRMAAVRGGQDLTFWLRRVMQILQQHAATKGGKGNPSTSDDAVDPWRASFEAAPGAEDRRLLLGRLLSAGDDRFVKHGWWAWVRLEPSSRLWLLEAFVLAKRSAVVPRLRALYGGAASADVREAIVRTVGLLGGEADVAWLAERLAGRTARRAALIALARIRTPSALERLRRARKEADAHEAAWIDHLLSPAFEAGGGKRGR
ncbi:MAG: hypothetical protein QNJ90_14855, partial [Planctomycetota bacterium]|nr:hypothetical protein [Planctomycetota bacterium]